MNCERSGEYKEPLQNLKHDDTKSRNCICHFRLHKYFIMKNLKFNMLCGINNHEMDHKLAHYPLVIRLVRDKIFFHEMTMQHGSAQKHTHHFEKKEI